MILDTEALSQNDELLVTVHRFGLTPPRLCAHRSEDREAEAPHSRRMSLQDLQADGALLGSKPQRAPVLHRHRPSPGRAALWQQGLRQLSAHIRGGGFYQPPPPQRERQECWILKSHISGKRVEEKTLFFKYAFQNMAVCTRLLCYISGKRTRPFVWMASREQCQEFTFALTAAWTTLPSSPCVGFHCDPALLPVCLRPLCPRVISPSFTTSVPPPLHTRAHTTKLWTAD